MFYRDRLRKLSGLLNEEVDILGEFHDDHEEEVDLNQKDKFDEKTKGLLMKYPAWLRAVHLWFHGAHHTTRGVAFAGDHAELYDRIYTEVQDEVDGAVEKIIGATGDQGLGCPKCLTGKALKILEGYASPAYVPVEEVAEIGLEIEKDYLKFVEALFEYLDSRNLLSLGLNDQLAGSANVHETYIYLLQQRVGR